MGFMDAFDRSFSHVTMLYRPEFNDIPVIREYDFFASFALLFQTCKKSEGRIYSISCLEVPQQLSRYSD
jgi:hypothetical protein